MTFVLLALAATLIFGGFLYFLMHTLELWLSKPLKDSQAARNKHYGGDE